MNSAPISPGISAISATLLSDNDPESAGGGQSATASGIDFAELLNNQQDAGKLMQRLEKLLPPEDFERLKLALEDGKSLPQAVTIAVGQLPDSGHWEQESPFPVTLPVQQSPFDAGEPQPLGNNPFAGSPDTIPDHAMSGDGDDARRVPVAQNLLQPTRTGSVVPPGPLQGMAVPVASASSVVESPAPLQPMSVASDKLAQAMSGDGDNAARISISKNLLSPGQAGSVAPSQPVQGLTVPATAIATDSMQAAGSLARLLAQPTISDQSPVFTPKVAAGTTPSPELVQHTVMDAVRTIPATPVTENLIQPAKPELAALQQFTATMSTATVAADQGAQASAAAAVSGGLGGTVSQTGGLLLQSTSPVNLNLEAPLGTRDWGEAVGERIMWMVGRSIQGATLRISPAHLGPIDIQLTMNQDQTNVSFSTQNGAVREALEAAIPRLREMFGESNLQLANVDVNQRQAEDQRGMFGNEGRAKGNGSERGEDAQSGMTDTGNESQSPNHLAEPNTDRLLDHYA